MKKMWKSAISIMAAVSMCAGLSACGGSGGTSTTAKMLKTRHLKRLQAAAK